MRVVYFIRALWRIVITLLSLVLGLLLLLPLLPLPWRFQKGIRLPSLYIQMLVRFLLRVFGIHFKCEGGDRLRNHHGLVVGNHLSYLDPILLAAVLPVRFLAAAGVRRLPLIGWFASALDTVYVDRKNQASRIAARQEIAQQLEKRTFPPLALFPEGSTGPGDRVLPFRRGTFEIAAEEGIAILPFVIVYAPLAAFHYYGEDDNLPKAIWRLANYPGKIQAYLRILSAIHPEQSSDPEATAVGIADETYAQIARLYTDLITRED